MLKIIGVFLYNLKIKLEHNFVINVFLEINTPSTTTDIQNCINKLIEINDDWIF